MVSPLGETPTYAKDNKNGFLSSLLAWIRGPETIIGGRDFPGFTVWDIKTRETDLKGLPGPCKTALTQLIKCDAHAKLFLRQSYRGSLDNDTLTELVCDPSCGVSLKTWYDTVSASCSGYTVSNSVPTKFGGIVWSGWNETCLQDPETGKYCNGN